MSDDKTRSAKRAERQQARALQQANGVAYAEALRQVRERASREHTWGDTPTEYPITTSTPEGQPDPSTYAATLRVSLDYTRGNLANVPAPDSQAGRARQLAKVMRISERPLPSDAPPVAEVKFVVGGSASKDPDSPTRVLIAGGHKSGKTSIALMVATRLMHGRGKAHQLLVVADEPQRWKHLGADSLVPDVETAVSRATHPKALIVVDTQAQDGLEGVLDSAVGEDVRLVVVRPRSPRRVGPEDDFRPLREKGWQVIESSLDSDLLLPQEGDRISYDQLRRLRHHPKRDKVLLSGVTLSATRQEIFRPAHQTGFGVVGDVRFLTVGRWEFVQGSGGKRAIHAPLDMHPQAGLRAEIVSWIERAKDRRDVFRVVVAQQWQVVDDLSSDPSNGCRLSVPSGTPLAIEQRTFTSEASALAALEEFYRADDPATLDTLMFPTTAGEGFNDPDVSDEVYRLVADAFYRK